MQDTRERLLDLAEGEIAERGYGAVSYGDLAKLAQIRKASIHHHFPAKADLGAAMMDRYGDHLAQRLAALSSDSRTGADALRGYIDECRRACADRKSMTLVLAMASDAPLLSQETVEMLGKVQRMVIQWLSRIMQRGRQDRSIAVPGLPDEEGLAAYVQLSGAQLAARAAGDPALFDAAIVTLTARMSRH